MFSSCGRLLPFLGHRFYLLIIIYLVFFLHSQLLAKCLGECFSHCGLRTTEIDPLGFMELMLGINVKTDSQVLETKI